MGSLEHLVTDTNAQMAGTPVELPLLVHNVNQHTNATIWLIKCYHSGAFYDLVSSMTAMRMKINSIRLTHCDVREERMS